MIRGTLVSLGFAAALPVCIVIGTGLGFYFLLLLHLLLGLDFPTGVSIVVGLMPVALAVMTWWAALKHVVRL